MLFTSFDGKEIYVHEWTDVVSPKGVVQIIHGMTEHGGRYEDFAKFLNDNGYIVVADDHRGHGKTDINTLGFCKGDMYGDTLQDEAEITKYYKKKYPGLKYFVFGFSYGSFITQSYIAKYNDLIDGAVITGSNKKKDLEVYFGSMVAGLANLFGRERKPAKFIKKCSFDVYSKKFSDGNWKSSDNENNQKLEKDKLCGFICSNRFYADFFRGLRNLYTGSYKKSLRKDLPLYLASGEDDIIGNMGKGMVKLYNFYKSVGVKNVRLVLYKNCRHEFITVKTGQIEKFNGFLEFFDSIIVENK